MFAPEIASACDFDFNLSELDFIGSIANRYRETLNSRIAGIISHLVLQIQRRESIAIAFPSVG
jgi:hypothetical protein